MPGVSRGMNWARLERAQMSLRQVRALLAAKRAAKLQNTGCDATVQTLTKFIM